MSDKLQPKSTDEEVENEISINAHKCSNILVLSLFR
jgi:hypothetical protein